MVNWLNNRIKRIKQIVVKRQAIIILIFVLFVITMIVKYWYKQYELKGDDTLKSLGPIGDFVGGIGGTIIGVISTILFVQTLYKQIESNRHDQIIDHENVIRTLINELYDDIYINKNNVHYYDNNGDRIYIQSTFSKIILHESNLSKFNKNYFDIIKYTITESNKEQHEFFYDYYNLVCKKLIHHYFLIIKYIFENINDDENAVQRIVLYMKNKIHNEILDQLNLAISLDKSNSELFEFAIKYISNKYNNALYLIPKVDKIEIDFEIEKSIDTYKFKICNPYLQFNIHLDEKIILNSFVIQIDKKAWEYTFITHPPLDKSFNNIIVKVNDLICINSIKDNNFIALYITYNDKTYEIYSDKGYLFKTNMQINNTININNNNTNLFNRRNPENNI